MPGGGYTAGGKAAARNVDSAANYAAKHLDDVDVADDVQAIYKVTDTIDDARDANKAATTIDDADTIHVFDDPPCVPNSFVAGTLVESSDGLVPIETLAEGDLVWAVALETGAAGWYPITWTTKHEDADLVTLSVTLLNADDETLSSTQERTIIVTITATLEHPFWVEGSGWMNAGDLQAGDTLLSADGRRLVVQAVVRSSGPAMVYNFTVDALHTYTITELRVVVHNVNCIGKTYGHHGTVVDRGVGKGVLPKDFTNEHAAKRLKQRGLTEHDVRNWQPLDTAVLEQANGAKHLYVTADGAWVVDTDGILVTAYARSDYKGADLTQLLSDMGITP